MSPWAAPAPNHSTYVGDIAVVDHSPSGAVTCSKPLMHLASESWTTGYRQTPRLGIFLLWGLDNYIGTYKLPYGGLRVQDRFLFHPLGRRLDY